MKIKGCPQIMCPKCKAQLFKALGKDKKNHTKVNIIENLDEISPENIDGDFLIRCAKCGKYISIKIIAA